MSWIKKFIAGFRKGILNEKDLVIAEIQWKEPVAIVRELGGRFSDPIQVGDRDWETPQ